ncbi:hypothetical protein CJ204_00810 [Corynebacterium xerosis]|uniref:Uncharacterized protein n=1 Tax=Corynebacterium xerosis TaxID=1725 RepID=A0A2N6T272_9CORY|nr:hypothetical protein [Corynebacterium xerosis]PMC63393.1 hypothetical protein CJ204_00810 [Corynebacterium xerosis]
MAREYAQIRLTIWNDDDFRALTPPAQWLYFLLLTHPTLTMAGVGDWRPSRLAVLAGADVDLIENAAVELAQRLYVVIDADTEEYLVRSFHRNDDLLKMPNMATAAARAAVKVTSAGLRGVLVHELHRLRGERPDLKGWASQELLDFMGGHAVDPASRPCWNPSGNPSRNPSVKGSGNPSIDPSGNPSGNPSEKGFPNPSGKGSDGGSGNPSETHPETHALQQTTLNTQHSPVGGKVVREGTTARETTPPPSKIKFDQIPTDWIDNPGLARCHKHATDEYPPPCGGCATAREAAEAAQDDRDAERRSAAATRRQTITACSLCDETGQILDDRGRPMDPAVWCTHDEDANAEIILDARQRAEAEAAAEAERRDRAAKAAAQARELRARLAEQRTSA